MLPWAILYKFLCGHMFAFLLGICLEVELLSHMVTLCLTIWRTDRLFSEVTTIYQQCMRVPVFLYACQHLLLSVFSILAILVGVKWYLVVGLNCISLVANDFFLFLVLHILCAWTMTFVHHCGIIQSIFTALEVLCALLIHPSPTTSGNHWSFFCRCSFACLEWRMVGIKQYVVFPDYLLSLVLVI